MERLQMNTRADLLTYLRTGSQTIIAGQWA